MKYFSRIMLLCCCMLQGCGFFDEPSVTCTERNLDATASLSSAILGMWKYCPPIIDYDDNSESAPTDYCNFLSNGIYLTYRVHSDGRIDGPNERIYAVDNRQIIFDPEGAYFSLPLQEIKETSIEFHSGGLTQEFYAVECQGLPEAAQ